MPKKKTRKFNLFKRVGRPTALIIVILVSGLIGLAFYWHNHRSNSKSVMQTAVQTGRKINYSPTTKADNAANNSRKSSSSTPSTTLENYQPPPNTGSFQISITRAGLDASGQNLQVASLIYGVSSGTCTLNVHKDGQPTVTRSEAVAFQVNSYVCPVITIPVSQFPVRGDWNVSMTVESAGTTVTSDWAKNPVSLD